jgi:hypothetical protein
MDNTRFKVTNPHMKDKPMLRQEKSTKEYTIDKKVNDK